jgi:hypothetical protein
MHKSTHWLQLPLFDMPDDSPAPSFPAGWFVHDGQRYTCWDDLTGTLHYRIENLDPGADR